MAIKYFVFFLKKSEALSSVAIRLVQYTGKAKSPIHPKHLLKKKSVWFGKYLNKKDRVLDIGCGVGVDALNVAIRVKNIIGLDVDEKSLKIAQKNLTHKNFKNVEFKLHDANTKLPFSNQSFHKVVCSDVLEHLNKRNFAVNEIKRVLKKNGLLLLVTDNPNTSWKNQLKKHGYFYYADYDHKYEYPKKEILDILKKKGFKVKSVVPVTYDTAFKGFIDLVGGISLNAYQQLGKWKKKMLKKHPENATGYKIVAQLK